MINKSMQITGPVASCLSYSPIVAFIISLLILLFGWYINDRIYKSKHPIGYGIIFAVILIIITAWLIYNMCLMVTM